MWKVRVAFVFPGQGSQYCGMGRELVSGSTLAKKVFELADEILDFDIKAVCWEENELINRTEYTQPALVAVELVCLAAILENGVRPAMAAGHSLGEYSALVAAGVLDAASALRLVRARGVITGEAASEAGGGMAAIMGMEPEALNALLFTVREAGVLEVSNYNAPGQVVVSGDTAALEEAISAARSLGAKRVVPLAVSGPFHSSLMKPAAEGFAVEIEATNFTAPSIPVIANYDAVSHSDSGVIGQNLVRHLYHPVRWEESVAAMSALGADVFLEVGPGQVLRGLIRRCDPGAKVLGVDSPDTLQRALEFLEEPALASGGERAR